jgi:hypothetical protein
MNNAIFSPGTVICDLFQYVSVRSPATQVLRQNGANAAATESGLENGCKAQSLAKWPRRGNYGGPIRHNCQLTDVHGLAKPNVRQLSCESTNLFLHRNKAKYRNAQTTAIVA